jgi:hypothetical protein
MYPTLLFLHSITRWLVVAGLLYAVCRAYKGYISRAAFSKTDDTVRHLTATIAHVQLIIGILVYTQSPLVKYFWSDFKEASQNMEVLFFGLLHLVLMLVAITVITIGSALAKRKATDKEKFKTMLTWFLVAFVIILLAIPWPFSPLAARPYFKPL